MPLILLCGYPSSGKSQCVEKLKEYFSEKRERKVHVVGDESIGVDRNLVYASSPKEKEVRGSLKSACERLISRDDILILDSLNYIKGFRYELYCISKAHKTPHCVVHCDTPTEVCRQWNKNRTNGYDDEIFDALVMRFEQPDSRNRWDSPLFTLQVNEEIPFDGIYDALINRKPPPPNQATQSQPLAATNFLHELDKITQEVLQRILEAQKTFAPGDKVSVPGATEVVVLGNQINMAELRRLRRQFIAYTKMHPVEDTSKLYNMFIQYLNKTI